MESEIIIHFSSKTFAGVRPPRRNSVPLPRSYGERSRQLDSSEKPSIPSSVCAPELKNDHRTGIAVPPKNGPLPTAPGGGPPGLLKSIQKA
jgi:hypothetical protein